MKIRKYFFAIGLPVFGILIIACQGNSNNVKSNTNADTITNKNNETYEASSQLIQISQTEFQPKLIVPINAPCSISGDTIYCKSDSGRISRFVSWAIPESDTGDGDHVKFEYLGQLSVNANISVLNVDFGHDGPSRLYWLRNTGKALYIICFGSDLAFSDSAFNYIIRLQEDSLNYDPPRKNEFFIYNNATANAYKCINANKLHASINSIKIPNYNRSVAINEILNEKDYNCVEDDYSKPLPDYFFNK